MKTFMDENFLLNTETAKELYHSFAKNMPIVDYHCHIDAKDIFEDKKFRNITELWLGGDHYKWRIMRSFGIDEKYITGDAPDDEKFFKFAECLPQCIGNPMYHWCHLELKRYFGYEGILNKNTSLEVWNLCNEKLKGMSARQLILESGVEMIGTTDDPLSTLEYHKKLAKTDFPVKVCPTFRPDAVLGIDKAGFSEYIEALSSASGIKITDFKELKRAIKQRLDYFKENGCRATDHGLDYVMYRPAGKLAVEGIFTKAMSGYVLTREECEIYKTELLLFLGREYHKMGLVMQLHFSCKRNPNSKALSQLGRDSGFDSIAPTDSADSLYGFMDALEREDALPKTILYSLNPNDNEWIDTLIGAFQDSSHICKIQHGSAWWFNDSKKGIRAHLESLAELSVLGGFVGMLTDSRSLVSYARHEYFRRILCAFLGELVENGEYPYDIRQLQEIVENICYKNAKNYFDV